MQLAKVLERQDFVDNFKRALAQEIAQVIAAYDHRVQAVYFIEGSANNHKKMEENPLSGTMTIQLLGLVTSTSATLKAFVKSLDRALSIVFCELPSKAFAMGNSFLEVVPISESDIEHGWGYAVLFSSIYGRPTEIWQRERQDDIDHETIWKRRYEVALNTKRFTSVVMIWPHFRLLRR